MVITEKNEIGNKIKRKVKKTKNQFSENKKDKYLAKLTKEIKKERGLKLLKSENERRDNTIKHRNKSDYKEILQTLLHQQFTETK